MTKAFEVLGRTVTTAMLLSLLGVSGAWAQAIHLEVAEVNGMKVLTTTSNHCPRSPNDPGCIEVARGSEATIRYVLPANLRCGDRVPQGHWVVSGVQLSMQNKRWNQPDLTEAAVSDFNADPLSGWINGITPSATVSITDENNSAYDVWYRVQASCTQSGEPAIYLDPKIGNTGR